MARARKISEFTGKKRPTCNEEGLCSLFEFILAEVKNANEKGLTYLEYTNDDDEVTRRGVAYKLSAMDTGLVLNYCPVCGADLKAVKHHPSSDIGILQKASM
jgi:hypothetical protein